MSLLLKNGKIISPNGESIADIFIKDEIISAIDKDLPMMADRVIDVSGKLIIPGGVDVHTHLSLPVGEIKSNDDFETGTRAAAFGGTTTIIDFAQQTKEHSLQDALDRRLEEAKTSVIDYSLHMVIVDMPDSHLHEIDEIVKGGIASFKLFTAYPNRLMVDDEILLKVLKRTSKNGSLVCIHAEAQDAITPLVSQALKENKTSPKYHALTRPTTAEVLAVKRVIELAKKAEAPVYFVHISCFESLEHICKAQSKGQLVFAETCPQYLFTSLEDFGRPNFEDSKYVFTPPPRERWNQEKLWDGLKDNSLQVVSTDHSPFNFHGQKDLVKNDFTKIPNGAPGIENRLQLLFHFGVLTGRISTNRWVELISTSPAKLFGLYPKKGTIKVGSDADIVIWNPETEKTISVSTHHMNVDYNLYEGWKVKGMAETVISRGEIIIENEKWLGKTDRGKFYRRYR
jgi:dihydropyrimidinase